jgi:hypothetical protein
LRPLMLAIVLFFATTVSPVFQVMFGTGAAHAQTVPILKSDHYTPNPPFYSPPQCFSGEWGYPRRACPPGIPAGCYWVTVYQGELALLPVSCTGPPLYATGSTSPNPERDTRTSLGSSEGSFCSKNPGACIKATPCPQGTAPGGSGIWTSTGVTAGRPTPNCVAQPPAPNVVQQQPAQTPTKFCAANPGKCRPPNGMAVSFCTIHPEQCSMPDAAKPQIGNPAAHEQGER